MYKVIIIDDEPLMIEGLLNMIDWNKYGFKVSGVASDGLLGLDLIKTIEPDVVITDIRMPGISGLELIETCQKELEYKCHFVVISGYNEFDYIKTAMDLKCVSYILKPIDQDEVHELLVKMQKKIMEESNNLDESTDVVIKMTLGRIITEPIKPSVIYRAEFLLDWSREKAYCFASVYGESSSKEQQIISMKAVAKEVGCKLIILGINNHKTSLIVYGVKEAVRKWSTKIKSHAREYPEQALYWLMISQLSDQLSELKDIVYLVDHNVAIGFYQRSPLVERLDTRVTYSNDLSLLDKYKLGDLVKKSKQELIDIELVQLFRLIGNKLPEPDFLIVTLNNFINYIEKQYKVEYTLGPIENFSQFKAETREMMAYFRGIEVKNTQEVGIDQVKEYVDNHYQDDVRLKSVAEIFGYNSVYLGQLFLKSYKTKYKDYVLKVRVCKAKELLLYTNYSIKQVAYSVGFSNPDYFVSKFKSVEGISPSRYRV